MCLPDTFGETMAKASKRENLTVKRAFSFNCEPGKPNSFVWDADSPGLGIKATPTGSNYIFEGRIHGKSLRITIGRVDAVALGFARSKAAEYRANLANGEDPRQLMKDKAAALDAIRKAEEDAKRDIERNTTTARTVWEQYIEARSSITEFDANSREYRSVWGARHKADHEKLAIAGGEAAKRGTRKRKRGVLADLLDKPLADITSATIAEWIEANKGRPASVALGWRLFRAFLHWTGRGDEFKGIADPAEIISARASVPRMGSKKDSLRREMLPLWFAGVRRIQSKTTATYLQLCLLTGARRNEMAALRWADVDMTWGSLTIRDKIEGERTIPLTPYAKSLLEALPRSSKWVFPGASKSGHLEAPFKAHAKALAAVGLPHVSIQGLRRSFKSLAEWVEVPAGITAQIMGHKPSATAEKHYTDRPLDLLTMWHARIEAWMLKEAGITFTGQTGVALQVIKTA